jgi:hypothetical protein
MTACRQCGAGLPPHTERVEFRDDKGKLQYHTHDMAKWLANLRYGVTPEQIDSWSQSERGSKRGLVFGFSWRPGTFGHDGKGEYCSIRCAAEAAMPAATRKRKRDPVRTLRGADLIDGPRLRAIRKKLKLTSASFALALGYGGTQAAREVMMVRFETGKRPIPPAVARVALLLEKGADR